MVQDSIESDEFFRPEHFILLNYTCHTVGDCEVVLNEEAQEYRWVSEETAQQLDLNHPTRVLLDSVSSRNRTAAHV